MPISKEILLSALEIIVAAILAYFIASELSGDPFSKAAALIVGSFGALHGLHRIITVLETKKSLLALEERVDNLSFTLSKMFSETSERNLIMLNDFKSRLSVGELNDLYNKIDQEFLLDKDDIISEARLQLMDLITNKESAPMYKAIYYTWITEHITKIKQGDRIYAISRMKTSEWENTPEERRFFYQNIDAATSGAIVERIFITSRYILKESLAQEEPEDQSDINAGKVFNAHSSKGVKNLIGWFADADRLEIEDSDLLKRVGDGFLMFKFTKTNNQFVLIDDFTDNDEARGRVNKNPHTISSLERSFENLKAMSEKF